MQYIYNKVETRIIARIAAIFGYAAILISRFGYFSLISSSDIVRINELTVILKIIGQCSIKCYDKNDKVSFEGLDINYHKYHFINKVVTTPPSPLTTEGCRLNMTTSVATTTMIGALTTVAPPADDKDESVRFVMKKAVEKRPKKGNRYIYF
jgi:hypothetical protein